MTKILKWFDLPPVWLALFLAVVWWATQLGFATQFGDPVRGLIGWLLVAVGVILMALAIFEMTRRRTTVIPHMQPTALVKTGIFAISRNPIYLGDALILAGFTLIWGASILFLLVIPAFMFVITRRFVTAEEMRLEQAFGRDFTTYCGSTRRWI